MTADNAIKILDPDAEQVWRGTELDDLDAVKKACRKAVKIMKKSMPMDVIYQDDGYDTWRGVNLYSCRCPACDMPLICFDDNDIKICDAYHDDICDMFHKNFTPYGDLGDNQFCSRCGQKLDWRIHNDSR